MLGPPLHPLQRIIRVPRLTLPRQQRPVTLTAFRTSPATTATKYNAIIDRAFAETDHGVRAKILLEAEQLLAKDMPVMPLYVHQDYYIMSKELSHSGKFTSYWGYRIFDKLDWKKVCRACEGLISEDRIQSVVAPLLCGGRFLPYFRIMPPRDRCG